MVAARMIAVLAAALLAACRSFEFEGQQILLRYQPETDVLDALLVYEGVGANKESEVESDAEMLARIGAGRRHFVLMDWILDFDLEKILEKGADPEAILAERFRLFSPNIRVLGASFVRGPDDELCLLQRVRIAEAASGLRLIDQAVNRMLLEDARQREPDGQEPTPDASMAELWLQRARSGGAWVRFDGGMLVVSVPATSRHAALTLAHLLESRDESLPSLARALTSLRVDGEEAFLAFAPGDDGWIRFAFDFEERGATSVAEIIAERDLIAAVPLEDEIRRLMTLE